MQHIILYPSAMHLFLSLFFSLCLSHQPSLELESVKDFHIQNSELENFNCALLSSQLQPQSITQGSKITL